MSSRLKLTIVIVFVGLVLLRTSFSGLAWLSSWELGIAAAAAGIALIALAFEIAPPDPRRPRGGPMEDPDKTLVIDPEGDGRRPDLEAARHRDHVSAKPSEERLVNRTCFVTATIGHEDRRPTTTLDLGEFHTVWRKGVRIGSDPACEVCLPDLAPVAAVLLAASNHKLLYLPGSPGFAAALDRKDGDLPHYDARVDYSVIPVGPYTVQFGERYEGGDAA